MLAERTAHGAPEKPVNEIQQALLSCSCTRHKMISMPPPKIHLQTLMLVGIDLLVIVLLFKLHVINTLQPLIFEVAEIENGQGLTFCESSASTALAPQTLQEKT